ncbi:MAG: BON domain-containing protein [Gammaproteobacteria bacterium]|nr:BON domain-containing protein [Gammaproteobacteria bacterium]
MKQLLTILSISFLLATVQACAPVLVVGTVAGASAKIAADRRAPEKIIEDNAVEIQATDDIYSNPEYGKKVRIEVTAFNGTVLLTGESPEESYKNEIVQKVGRMRTVDRVIDNIEIKEPISMQDRSNDFWISSKVSSKLIAHRGLITRTRVITTDGTVYLMGLVNNEEAKEILNIVKQVEGIDAVVPLFESLDGTLDENLNLVSHISKPAKSPEAVEEEKKTKLERKLEAEDEITVQPYVLQPPIRLNDGN